jgi:hypothetical protein
LTGCLNGVPDVSGQDDETTNTTDSSDSTNFLGALSKGGPSKFSDSNDVRSGWVHTVANGETYGVTFDVRICHNDKDEVKVELYKRTTGEYALSFTTNGGTHGESDCSFGTRITGSGSIPTDFESLNIDVNGGTLETIEKKKVHSQPYILYQILLMRDRCMYLICI